MIKLIYLFNISLTQIQLLKLLLLLLWLLLYFQFSYAQVGEENLKTARQFIASGHLARADSLLTAYNVSTKDPLGLQLHAHLLYLQKRTTAAKEVYVKAINLFPRAEYLQLDYGRMLYQTGKLNAAATQLQSMDLTNTNHVEAEIMLTNLLLWKGDVDKARERVLPMRAAYPGNESISAAHDLLNLYAPYVSLSYNHLVDDQPLIGSAVTLEAGYHRSSFIAPHISASFFNYDASNIPVSGSILNAGNTFKWGYGSTILKAEAGVFTQASKLSFIGSANVTQKILKNTNFQMGVSRQPYQFTLASLQQPIVSTVYTGAINYNNNEKILGKASFETQAFDDGNQVSSLYTWFLLPLVYKKNFTFQSGYSFSYSNSRYNTFNANTSLGAVVATQPLYSNVSGVYLPIFTPRNQVVHALLLSSAMKIAKGFHLFVNGSVGVQASADNPVLILDKNSGGQPIFSKYYYKQKYTPVEFSTTLQAHLSQKLSLSSKYTYSSFIFYIRSNIHLQLNYRFLNAK